MGILSRLFASREPYRGPTDTQRQASSDAHHWRNIDRNTQEGNRALGLDAASRLKRGQRQRGA